MLLASQAAFDLGHEVLRKPQGIEGLLEGLSSLLCLAAITREALLRCAVALSGFRVLFGVSWGGRRGALLDSVWVCGDCRLPKRP